MESSSLQTLVFLCCYKDIAGWFLHCLKAGGVVVCLYFSGISHLLSPKDVLWRMLEDKLAVRWLQTAPLLPGEPEGGTGSC